MGVQQPSYTSAAELKEAYSTVFSTFATGKTKNLKWRKWQLKQIWWLLSENEDAFVQASQKDLQRGAFETHFMELSGLKTKTLYYLEKVEEWAKDNKPKGNGLLGYLGDARVRKEPLGVSLIMGAWNSPIILIIEPLLCAIAAGCCAILKPSELAPHIQDLFIDLVAKYLDPSAIRVISGGAAETSKILELKFNHIFYTGSSNVGRIVAAAAAKHLTPCVLELGGLGPTIVTASANLDLAAKRIAWTKFFNAGQICIAVNHVFVDPSIHDEFVEKLKVWFVRFFKDGKTDDYTGIVNERHFDRLAGMLGRTKGKIERGGKTDRSSLFIDPAIVTEVDMKDPLLEQEIFGPILPIIKADYRSAIQTISAMPHPLSLYIFGKDQAVIDEILDNTNSGGACINDAMMHITLPNVPFGGVGESGYGAFHGETGFLAFTHLRTVFMPPDFLSHLTGFMYPPYNVANLWKLGTPTKVPFKKGETMEDQKIGGGWGSLSTAVVGSVIVAGAAYLWKSQL